jgi:hypothetical protein
MHLAHIWSVVESIRKSSRENESSLLIEEYSVDNRTSSVVVLIEIINYTINSSVSIPRPGLVQILQLFKVSACSYDRLNLEDDSWTDFTET